MKENTIKLKNWIIQKIEDNDVDDDKQLIHLYQYYHRIRLWEAVVNKNQGPRMCPYRN